MITTTTLKNAAFAIEHDLFTDPDGCNYLVKDGAILRRWEPETSSADSFELMNSLDLWIERGTEPSVHAAQASWVGQISENYADHAGDKNKAARHAIVRAAAEIGAAR